MHLLSYRSTSLEFRSLIDFSNYSNKDLPKLVPFPNPANTVQESSCSSSYTSLFTTDTATSQRATTQSTSDSDGDVAIVVDVDDGRETSSSDSDVDGTVSTYLYSSCVCCACVVLRVYACVHAGVCVPVCHIAPIYPADPGSL